eukprot:m.42260 g.42260  ORF g.42260 m.42260 type:complete len:289 (-) comp10665_c0_seq2:179-1045(-)
MKRIAHMQNMRDKVEKEWQEEQKPEKVAKRVQESMPTQQDLRRYRQLEHKRSGATPLLAKQALSGILGARQPRDPKKSSTQTSAKRDAPSPITSTTTKIAATEADPVIKPTVLPHQSQPLGMRDRPKRTLHVQRAPRHQLYTPPSSNTGTSRAASTSTNQSPPQHKSAQPKTHSGNDEEEDTIPNQYDLDAGDHFSHDNDDADDGDGMQAQSGSGSSEDLGRLLYKLSVTLGEAEGAEQDEILIHEGEEIFNVVQAFGKRHNMTEKQKKQLFEFTMKQFEEEYGLENT